MKFVILDLHNLLFRVKHSTIGEIDVVTGMAIHITFNSISKIWSHFNPDHLVVCLEGKSWRREIYPDYKAHRRLQESVKSDVEKENDDYFFSAMNDLISFLNNRSNVTCLQSYGLEADDLIAMWIDHHPNDDHIIVSTDTDFIQLLSPNVSIYNGVNDTITKLDGVYDLKDQPIMSKPKYDKKTGNVKVPAKHIVYDPEWELFLKIIRGDSTDNIFSAYPKIRENKLKEAYNDRINKGFDWANIMNQTWVDHKNNIRKVNDCFEFNKLLIDLKAQPPEIKELGKSVIDLALQKPYNSQVGFYFLKFCNQYNLERILKAPDKFLLFLNKPYKEQTNVG